MANQAGVRSISDLRTFGNQVKQMGNQVCQLFHDAQTRMKYVSEGWQDRQNETFMAQFDQTVKMMDIVKDQLDNYSQFIEQSCRILEDYVNNRIR